MSAELLLLTVGSLLVVLAALAGKRRTRTIGYDRAVRTARVSVASTGVLCLVSGLILLSGSAADAPAGPVRVTIEAELAPKELSEEVRVFLDGRDRGVVRVDERSPVSRLAVTVDAIGRHDYRLESTRQVRGKRPEKAARSDDVIIDRQAMLGIFFGPDGKVYLLDLR